MHVHTHTDILTTDLSSIIYLHLCIGDFSYLSIPLWCESLFILAKENGKIVKMAIFGSQMVKIISGIPTANTHTCTHFK